MSKIKFTILTMATTLLFLFASATSVFACWFSQYQPETPKSLIK
ncbi:MAG: cyclic lactone autoinducer peptide [Clostridia bacterium]|jgi:cyclic lactone autoinducer peptide|nr:cyclic lactone autoinducer peptide [Clostridia bacterium]